VGIGRPKLRARKELPLDWSRARDVIQNGALAATVSLHRLDDWLTTTLREGDDMEIFRKALVAAVTIMCCISIAASCFLALSYTMLKGPGDIRPLLPLALFVAQGAVTLVALNTILSGFSIDLFALVGALGIAWLGYTMVERTLSGAHFEGYALVFGHGRRSAGRADAGAVLLAIDESRFK
jgi:hypothetical protein